MEFTACAGFCATTRKSPTTRSRGPGGSALAAPFRDCRQVAGQSGVATMPRARTRRRRLRSPARHRCRQHPRLCTSVRSRCSVGCNARPSVPRLRARNVHSKRSPAPPIRRELQQRRRATRPLQPAATRVRRANSRAARAAGPPGPAAMVQQRSAPRYSSAGAAPRAAVKPGTPTAARIFASISAASSGCSFRYSRALSLPCPILSP